MVDPRQEPTQTGPSRLEAETLDLHAPTDAEDPEAAGISPLASTELIEEQLPTRAAASSQPPKWIGRYRIERRLGRGGFGTVYLAHDEQLDRPVAIKVPHASLVASVEHAGPYLAEARAVAQLDHPNIVPVYDVGSDPQIPCYIVSKFIDGETLAARIRRNRPGWIETAELVATIAAALNHAHDRGLVHRDVKPGNILIDLGNTPHVVDFGVALRDGDHGQGPRYVGTPAYMSPEQAWGEGHRVDRRSDIFSLGVVLYELLCGVRPFPGPSREALMIQLMSEEPRPPCQTDGSIPGELERICLKALAKRAIDRYPTAGALAEDLRQFLAAVQSSGVVPPEGQAGAASAGRSRGDTAYYLSRSLQVVPKGLRSFNERDAGFFVELLPGPRDRDDLPESLRFWKDWAERAEPGPTAAIGLIYGPSGCGKTSLVKAGLIPRLDRRVLTAYVEATAEETETRLLAVLRRRCPGLPAGLELRDSLAALRLGQGLPSGSKVLLVLDQFEQWLHARRGDEAPLLVQVLRQCDGEHVQCLVMVRDDFWMAATRFLRALEVPLVEGRNAASVDLFDPAHARRVLAAFGRAYGKLDNSPSRARERDAFLSEAVRGLTQEGKVVCVRLALFAEMMKSRNWTRGELLQVGGARGVGFTFLEENFGSVTAPPAHLHHQLAARAVLAALLPESGTDIKGHMRSETDLLRVSGYASRPTEFEELIRILDGELRLITPTDPEGLETDLSGSQKSVEGRLGQRYYQLTHDYLVHSLSDWLTHKQRESPQGRAVLCLQERASLWGPKPEARFLPSIGECLSIWLLTDSRTWSQTQRAMMRRAGRRYGLLGGLIAVAVALLAWTGHEARSYLAARALVGSLRTAGTPQVPAILVQLAGDRRWADPQLRSLLNEAAPDSRARLHASLGLLGSDPSQVAFLTQRLLESSAGDLPVIREALAPYHEQVEPLLWAALSAAPRGDVRILAAASGLARYAPGDPRWTGLAEKVAHELVGSSPVELGPRLEALRRARAALIPPLEAIFRDPSQPASKRILATNVLADYASDRPGVIAGLLTDADPDAFSTLLTVAMKMPGRVAPLLRPLMARRPESGEGGSDPLDQEARDRLARRQARAAAALFLLGREQEILPLLQHSPDPHARSYLTIWLHPLGASPQSLADRIGDAGGGTSRDSNQAGTERRLASMEAVLFDPATSTRRALILALGHVVPHSLDPQRRASFTRKLLAIYRDDPDAGVHGAAAWALRRWGEEAALQQLDAEAAARGRRPGDRWFTNSLGMTLAVVEGPVEFDMGSRSTEPEHESLELLHRRVIPRRFAIGTTEVTLAQFKAFLGEKGTAAFLGRERFNSDPRGPVCTPSWYEAAAFCNWLSLREKLQPCYEPDSQGHYGPGMKIPADARDRSGYRLPTEAEWEYSCRAGTSIGRYFGGPSLLDRYAWFNMNADGHAHPCGLLLPNDLGLFDMIGNVDEWCEDRLGDYRPGPDGKVLDRLDAESALDKDTSYILRGGYFGDVAAHLNAAHRIWNTPHNQLGAYGFRVARTLP